MRCESQFKSSFGNVKAFNLKKLQLTLSGSVKCLIWSNKPLQPYFDARTDRQAYVVDEQGLNLIQIGLHLNRPWASFEQVRADSGAAFELGGV